MIRDEFTARRISRQRKYQLRRQKQGRCIICGKRSVPDHDRCPRHRLLQDKRNRKWRVVARRAASRLAALYENHRRRIARSTL